jgi:hypothetical protein
MTDTALTWATILRETKKCYIVNGVHGWFEILDNSFNPCDCLDGVYGTFIGNEFIPCNPVLRLKPIQIRRRPKPRDLNHATNSNNLDLAVN